MLQAVLIAVTFLAAVATGLLAVRLRWTRLPDPATRIGCIDGLRGYLALAVMIHHFTIWLGVLQGRPWAAPESHVLNNFGQGAVALFFMVTGALFYGKVANGPWQTDWRSLYVSRVFRLVPLFWFAFVLVNVIVFARNGLSTGFAKYAEAAAKWMLFLNLPPFNGVDAGRIVAYAPWTLKYEWICYFTLPLVALVLSIAAARTMRLVLLAALMGLCVAAPRFVDVSGTVHWSLLLLVPFFLGMAAMILADHPVAARVLRSPWAAIVGIAALVFEMTMFPASFAFMPCIVLFIFFVPIVAGNSCFGLFAARPSIVLGEASYGIYLLHGIVLFVAFADAAPLVGRFGIERFWFLLPILAIVLVAAAIVLHEWLEKPAIRFGRNFRAQPLRTAVTSTSTLNSGLVKPDTMTSVEAKALPET